MGKEYVPIFLDWLETTQDLSQEEKGNLIDAVVSYASGVEYEHYLTGGSKIAFRFLKGQVDRNNAISEARSRAGSIKKEQTPTNDIKQEQNESNDNKTEQTTSNFPKEKEKEKENNNKKDKEKENKEKSEPAKRFTPPTLEEVREYCAERKNNIDPEHFVDYNIARNWILSNGKKMVDWKATIRTWEKMNFNGGSIPAKTVPAQQYEQREYIKTQDEARKRMIAMMQEERDTG